MDLLTQDEYRAIAASLSFPTEALLMAVSASDFRQNL